ncbi:MAG: hypothetical protein HKL95_10095 [Phycisphaerae bacterium]|nr:hypothetical protein [Phycisphaerae bacterium]
MSTPDPKDNAFDAALVRRLRGLATLPVDTGALDQRLRRAIPGPRRNLRRFGVGLAAGAAAFLMMGWVLFSILSATLARASLADLTHAYQLAVSRGPVHAAQLTGSSAAAALAQACTCLPGLKTCPMAKMSSCYMIEIGHHQISCALLSSAAHPVVLLTGNRVAGPKGQTVNFQGIQYQVVRTDHLNLIEGARHGRWMCLMGRSSPATLLRLASRLRN